MPIVVLLPTFQRPQCLEWSLQSVLSQDTSAIPPDERIRVIIINHDTEHLAVDAAVRRVKPNPRMELKVIHSGPPASGFVKSYDELMAHTAHGDIAMIHGDDDIMVQGSLATRYTATLSSGAAVSVCKWHDGILFFRDRDEMFLKPGYEPRRASCLPEWRHVEPSDLSSFGLPFLSAYCYRMGDEFASCCDQALSWGLSLPLDFRVGLLMSPFFLGISAWHKQQLIAIPHTLVQRGRLLSTYRSFLAPRHIATPANYGIVILSAMAVLKNADLCSIAALDDLRSQVEKECFRSLVYAWTRKDDPTTTRSQLSELLRLSGLSLRGARRWTYIAPGVVQMAKSSLGLSGLRARLSGWGKPVKREEFWPLWDR